MNLDCMEVKNIWFKIENLEVRRRRRLPLTAPGITRRDAPSWLNIAI